MSEGFAYRPPTPPAPVVEPGEFVIAAIGLEHGHIYGMVEGLLGAGATLAWVFDPDPAKVAKFQETFPQARAARDQDEILADSAVRLVASAAIPADRADLAVAVMQAGKDFFTDKAPVTTLEGLARVRGTVGETGAKFAVYYSERVHVEAAVLAGHLVDQGAIGEVVQVLSLGPHRIGNPAARPDWFYDKSRYGGIIIDIGSHNFEQLLHFTGATSAEVLSASVANHAHPQFPQLEDYGDVHLRTNTGAAGYIRVDWLTPTGLRTWGDGRTVLLGTEGYIELRKYLDVARSSTRNNLFLVNADGEHYLDANGATGFPYFGELILDCINRTDIAMPQERVFAAAELAIRAQLRAEMRNGANSPPVQLHAPTNA